MDLNNITANDLLPAARKRVHRAKQLCARVNGSVGALRYLHDQLMVYEGLRDLINDVNQARDTQEAVNG